MGGRDSTRTRGDTRRGARPSNNTRPLAYSPTTVNSREILSISLMNFIRGLVDASGDERKTIQSSSFYREEKYALWLSQILSLQE